MEALKNLYLRAGVATAMLVPGFAMAATDPFDTALTDVSAKVTTYATGLVTIAAVAVGFLVAAKYVKKIVGAS